MAQNPLGAVDPDTTDGTELADLLTDWRDSLHSSHKGSSRPAYVEQGMIWIDDAATPWSLKLYDGAADILLGRIDPTKDFAGMIAVRRTIAVSSARAITPADDGAVFVVDASGAPVTLTMAAVSTFPNGFSFAVLKSDDSANKVTMAANGTDKIGVLLSSSIFIERQGAAEQLVADGSSKWQQVSSAAIVGEDYTEAQTFIKDSGSTITLDETPPSVYSMYVEVAGIRQWPGEDFIIAGNVLTWLNATNDAEDGHIEFRGRRLDIGVPGEGAVTYSAIQEVSTGGVVLGRESAAGAGIVAELGVAALRTILGAATTSLLGLIERATVAEVRDPSVDGKFPTVKDLYDGAAPVTLTDAATIAVDLSTGINFEVTLGGNRTLGNFSNVVSGKSGRIKVIQDGTGSRTLTKSANHKLANGGDILLSEAAAAEDFIDYDCVSSTEVRLVVSRGWG